MKLVTLKNLNRFLTHAKREIGNTNTVIHKSVNPPENSYGEDGDVWILHDHPNVLISVTYSGTTVTPLTNKDYIGLFNPASEYINELNGNFLCSSYGASVGAFTVNLKPGFTYRFLNYSTGQEDENLTLNTEVSGTLVAILEVTNSKTLKKYLYKIKATQYIGY